jgi:hypothetical protein
MITLSKVRKVDNSTKLCMNKTNKSNEEKRLGTNLRGKENDKTYILESVSTSDHA